MFLLDTNIISELIKKQPNPYLFERMKEIPSTALHTASVCAMELRFGALRVPNSEALWTRIQKRILARIQILPFGYQEAMKAAEILTVLYASGRPIGVEDTMISSTALSNGLIVVTANTEHFSRVPGLQSENWLLPDQV
jgi:predicted nucleic acid-binding protein